MICTSNFKTTTTSMLLFMLLLFSTTEANSQLQESFQYISPCPGAKFVTNETYIVLRPGEFIDLSSSNLDNIAVIKGSLSGIHQYKAIVANDDKTINLKPETAFEPGEKVSVNIIESISTQDGSVTNTGSYSFTVSPKTDYSLIKADLPLIYDDYFLYDNKHSNDDAVLLDTVDRDPSLPLDFPNVQVSVNDNPDSGYIFICAKRSTGPYLMILDNSGYPVFYRKMSSYTYDFKKHPNNMLSYNTSGSIHYVMDSTYTVVDSYRCVGGYESYTNNHDFQLLEDNHALVVAYDPQIIDMSQIIECGQEEARVYGYIFQELDADKNLLFEWRSWDHYEITDAVDEIDLCASSVDYVHGNSVERDADGNYVISCRKMNEVTKIDGQTGEIMWRLSGENNDFTFVNDTLEFSWQHDARVLPNGNITVFDNGCWYSPNFSRASEYAIDTNNMTATLVWSYRNDPDIYGFQNGNVQRLSNGNTMIGWGGPTVPTLTEVHPDSTIAFELTFGDSEQCYSYRSFRYPWHGKATAPYLIVEQEEYYTHMIFHKFGDDDVVKYYIYAGIISGSGDLLDSTVDNYYDIEEFDYTGTDQVYLWATAVSSQNVESAISNIESCEIEIQYDYYEYLPGDANMAVEAWPAQTIGGDVTYLVNYFRGLTDACMLDGFYASADATGDCQLVGGDVTYLVYYFRGLNDMNYCVDYEPAWPTSSDVPTDAPDGWPNCD